MDTKISKGSFYTKTEEDEIVVKWFLKQKNGECHTLFNGTKIECTKNPIYYKNIDTTIFGFNIFFYNASCITSFAITPYYVHRHKILGFDKVLNDDFFQELKTYIKILQTPLVQEIEEIV